MARHPASNLSLQSPASHTSRAALAHWTESEWLTLCACPMRAQEATNELTLADAQVQHHIMHTNKMLPDGDSGVTNFGALNEVPLDNHLLAEEPGGAPPEGTKEALERLANNDQVNITEDGDTLDCGREKVPSLHTGRG